MNFYVTLTTHCNLRCKYCYGKSCEDFGSDFHGLEIDYSVPARISYETKLLQRFLQAEKNPVLIFYGGEPLLQVNRLTEIMDSLPAARFVIQTNGLLLNQLRPDYINRIDSIFVSLDGDEALTDYYRGRGTYRRVMNNLKKARDQGFKGEVVARMTVGDETEIDKQVLALAENIPSTLSSIHWQLDALFWQNDFPKRRFREWTVDSYNPRLRRLARLWVNRMQTTGEVLRLYPFLGVTYSLLTGESSSLRCGAGLYLFNVQTDGTITPCPVMAGMKDFYLGHLRRTDLVSLSGAVSVKQPCTGCDIFTVCGGRCLYANVTKLWGDEGFRQVCATVRNLKDALSEMLPEIKRMMDSRRIHLSDFAHQQYNGCEIIP